MSLLFWRLSIARKRSDAFRGARAGGRWNTAATHPVYTADSVALAALERLLYAEFRVEHGGFQSHHLYRVDLADWIPVVTLAALFLPDGWFEMAAPLDPLSPPTPLQLHGDAWYRGCKSAALIVPSAHAWEETNALLNPEHPAFGAIAKTYVRQYRYDQRYSRRE